MKPNVRVLALLLLMAACSTNESPSSRATSPDDALLVEVSNAERAKVSASRQDASRARDAHAAAKSNYEKACDHHVAVGRERELADTSVANAESSLREAKARGSTVEVARAQAELDRARTGQQWLAARMSLAEKRVDLAAAMVTVAREHVATMDAHVDLAKVRAVNSLDRPGSQKPRASDFELVVRNAELQERVAQVRVDGAKTEVDLAKAALLPFEASSNN